MSEIKTLFLRDVSPEVNAALNRYRSENNIAHASKASAAMLSNYYSLVGQHQEERSKRIELEVLVERFVKLLRTKQDATQALEDLVNSL